MATYSTLGKICHADADASGSGSWRHMATIGVACIAMAQAGQYRGLTSGTCSAQAVVSGKQQHKRPAIATAVVSGTTVHHRKTLGQVAVATAVVSGSVDHNRPSIARYELYHAIGDSPFDWAHPAETYTSLPHTTSATFLTPGKHRFCLRELNAYGYSSENWNEHVVWVRPNGEQVLCHEPSPPQGNALEQTGVDGWTVGAIYETWWENSIYWANHWNLYVTTDGTIPDPDSPTTTWWPYALAPQVEPYVLPPAGRYVLSAGDTGLANGTVVKARSRMTLDLGTWGLQLHSEWTDILTLTINDSGPPAPVNLGIDYYREATDD